MEEASSIAKAIETAWNRAGQPTEFSVKVLELPQTSFFGLKTSKSAKVAFFFNEATVTVKPKDSTTQQRQGQQRPVTLRQPGNRPESDYAKSLDSRSGVNAPSAHPEEHRSDASRRATDRHDQRRSGQGQRPERSESREPRETRELRDASTSTERRENRNFDQRDQRNRPQGSRRTDYTKNPSDRSDRPDYAKSLDYRAGVNAPSAHSEEHRSDASGRATDRHEDRPRRSDYVKTSDRHDDRRQRYESERNDSGYTQERESWTPEMVQVAQEWIKETLVLMGKPDINVTTHISHNYLKVNLSAPVLEDARQEETQLKSWSMLAMEAVREKAGKSLRSLRIALESPRQ